MGLAFRALDESGHVETVHWEVDESVILLVVQGTNPALVVEVAHEAIILLRFLEPLEVDDQDWGQSVDLHLHVGLSLSTAPIAHDLTSSLQLLLLAPLL